MTWHRGGDVAEGPAAVEERRTHSRAASSSAPLVGQPTTGYRRAPRRVVAPAQLRATGRDVGRRRRRRHPRHRLADGQGREGDRGRPPAACVALFGDRSIYRLRLVTIPFENQAVHRPRRQQAAALAAAHHRAHRAPGRAGTDARRGRAGRRPLRAADVESGRHAAGPRALRPHVAVLVAVRRCLRVARLSRRRPKRPRHFRLRRRIQSDGPRDRRRRRHRGLAARPAVVHRFVRDHRACPTSASPSGRC